MILNNRKICRVLEVDGELEGWARERLVEQTQVSRDVVSGRAYKGGGARYDKLHDVYGFLPEVTFEVWEYHQHDVLGDAPHRGIGGVLELEVLRHDPEQGTMVLWPSLFKKLCMCVCECVCVCVCVCLYAINGVISAFIK